MTDRRQDTGSDAGAGSPSVTSTLLARIRLQDEEAWRRLVQLFHPLVIGWCRRAGVQDQDAADVAQEVFRAVATDPGRFRRDNGRNSFRGWLHGITQRQLLAHWRRQRKQPRATGGSAAQERLGECAAPQDEAPSVVETANERR